MLIHHIRGLRRTSFEGVTEVSCDYFYLKEVNSDE